MTYGLLGEHLGHSFSQDIHRRIGDYPYALFEVAPPMLSDFIKNGDFSGINVTIPYKQTVIPYLDEIDPRVREIGAVNTIVRREGRLFGYNTDFDGMRMLIASLGVPVKEKKALVLGTGGTSLTAVAVLRSLGASEIFRVSRSGKDGSLAYEEALRLHADAAIIINTTPVGMYPNVDGTPIELAPFSCLSLLVDAVYNPLRTDLVLAARARGIPAAGGLLMLAAQAVAAARHFGCFAGEEEACATRIFEELRAEKENIVLVGMPGSGKSTVGRILAARTGRPFFDLDELIVAETEKEIPAIFADVGEAGFRDIEAAVLERTVSEHMGAVISTGGGAILRLENVKALRRGGRLYFLDRPLSHIRPTASRPLSSDRAALEARYQEREPLYRAAADVTVIPQNGDPTSTADAILADFFKRNFQ